MCSFLMQTLVFWSFLERLMKAWVCDWSAQSSWLCVLWTPPVLWWSSDARRCSVRASPADRGASRRQGRGWRDAWITITEGFEYDITPCLIDTLLLLQDILLQYIGAALSSAPSYASISQLNSFLGFVDRKPRLGPSLSYYSFTRTNFIYLLNPGNVGMAASGAHRCPKSEKLDEAQALAKSCAGRPDFLPCDGLSICATHSHGKCFKLHWCCHLGWCHCKFVLHGLTSLYATRSRSHCQYNDKMSWVGYL